MTRRSWLVYGTLLAIWILLLGWQVAEHSRMRHAARAGLRHRAEDISNTLALMMRSQHFVVSSNRVESILNELIKQDEIYSVELLNVGGEKLASAGPPIEVPAQEEDIPTSEYWDENAQTVMFRNLVDLGTNIIRSGGDFLTNRPPPGEPPPGPPPPGEPPGPPPGETNFGRTASAAGLTNADGASETNDAGRRNFRYRPRLTPQEREELIKQKSAHGFILVMSARILNALVARDLWLRAFIVLLATVAVAGFGLAWNNLIKTSELQLRLVRASELSSQLKQMNLAAAGLAHETRNPLNIVRGLAQMISKQEDASPEIRIKSREIIDETDRVAAQLNEFINYSRPREVRSAATKLDAVVAEVARTLNYDIEEKKVRLVNQAEELEVNADEQLLRQALFNLVLNAIQAVHENGEIYIRSGKTSGTEAFLEIADNGPGVAPEHRGEIFKPYFTTHEEGTGLGLAVVRQIVLAHNWEIECLDRTGGGACFRITHIKLTLKSRANAA
jgi:signal transduction histidine kinase